MVNFVITNNLGDVLFRSFDWTLCQCTAENLCKSRLETHDKTVVARKMYFFVKPLLTGNTCGIIY